MAEFNLVLATTIAVLTSFIPGFLLAYPLLRKTGLRFFEIMIFGFTIGVVLPPALLFFESLAGIGFSLGLVFTNIAILSVIGLVLIFKDGLPKGTFTFATDLDDISGKIDLFGKRKNLIMLSLLVIFLFAYWVRITGFQANPYFHSPDPYSYLVTTRYIVMQGSVPENDDLAWSPNSATHRERPLMQYMLAGWYSIYTGGASGFDNLTLLNISNIYPALFGAVGCLLLFILLSRFVGDEFGVFGALQGTLLPITIITVAWGPEQVPWALFSMLAFFASYALYTKESRWEYAILSAISMIGVALGSKGDLFVYSVFGVYVVLQGTLLFLSRKLERKFALHNVVIGLAAIVPMVPYYYMYKLEGLEPVVALGLALLYVLALTALAGFFKVKASRQALPTAIMGLVIVASLAYVSPLGVGLTGYVKSLFGTSNLFTTIAEQQGMTSSDYTVALGAIGIGIGGIKLLDLLAVVFLALVAFDFAYRGSRTAVLLAILVLPLYLLFSSDLKFVPYLGVMTAIMLTVCLGKLHQLTQEIKKGTEGSKDGPDKNMLDAAGHAAVFLLVALAIYQIGFIILDISPFFLVAPSEVGGLCDGLGSDHQISQKIFCNKIPARWIETLGWLRVNTDREGAVLAWWDYGDWINYLGERKVLIRNDLAYPGMIQEVAGLLTRNETGPLAGYMKFEKSGKPRATYLLLDQDIIEKWSAITYLSCFGAGKTGEAFSPIAEDRSTCEKELDFEFFQEPSSITLSDYCPGEKQTHFRILTNRKETYCIPTKVDTSTEIFDKEMRNPKNVTIFVMNVVRENFISKAYLLLYREKEAKQLGGVYGTVFYSGWDLGKLDNFDGVYSTSAQAGTPSYISIYKVK